jgi:hypothetical protein
MTEPTFKTFLRVDETKVAEAEETLNEAMRAIENAQQRGDLSTDEAAELKRQALNMRENFATARDWLRTGDKVPHEMIKGPERLARNLLVDMTMIVEQRRMRQPAWQRAVQRREGRLAEMRRQLDSDLAATRPPRTVAERAAALQQKHREVFGW